MNTSIRRRPRAAACLVLSVTTLALMLACGGSGSENRSILNVSYDPTREFYREYNQEFIRHWAEQTGEVVGVTMSHGGSGSQARAVIDGLEADVVTLALAHDIDAIALHAGLLPQEWQGSLPHNNAPYTSTLAFLVRKGNPKGIHDWDDLVREGVSVITPNPKTSGVARWNYLAAWGYALRRELGPDFESKIHDPTYQDSVAAAQVVAMEFMRRLYANVPVLDRAARAATNTFIQRRIGDVLINWENEILLGGRELDEAGLEIVVPSVSILAEPAVAVVKRNAERHGNLDLAQAYLEYLYSPVAQEMAARNFYRPASSNVLEQNRHLFPDLELFTIDEVFGGWAQANEDHFIDGARFDRLFQPQ